jgi:ADP-heptose:LPS heptosyltransferase
VRVLLVRLDGIGDAAVCIPLIDALRRAGHTVGAALTTRNAGLFAPGVLTAEHVLERIPWPAHGSTPASSARAHAEIAAANYDAALIASEEPEAYRLAGRIPIRIGFTTGFARPLKSLWVRGKMTRIVRRSQRIGTRPEHEVQTMFRLGADLLGGGTVTPSADALRLRRLLIRIVRPDRRGPLLLQAGPKWQATGVEARSLQTVLRAFADDIHVVCAPHEADDVRASLGVEPRVFTELHAWVAELDRARCVLTVDSGAAHVAGMLGRPVIDVFPDANADAQIARWRPWASRARTLTASAANGGSGATLVEAVHDV